MYMMKTKTRVLLSWIVSAFKIVLDAGHFLIIPVSGSANETRSVSAPGPNGPVNQSSPTPPHSALQLHFMGLCWPVSRPLILKSIYYLPSVERLFALTGMLRLLGLLCCRLPLFALQATLMAPPPPPPAAGSLTPVR